MAAYSDTSNKNGLLQKIEHYLGFSDGKITGNTTLKAVITSLLNAEYSQIISAIFESQDEWDWDDSNQTTFPIATASMVANQRDYTLPALLKIQRVDVTYNGTDWYKAQPISPGEIQVGMGDDSDLDAYFSKTAPRYDVRGNSTLIYPRASSDEVAAGAMVRIEFLRSQDFFTTSDSTQEPGIDEPFHEMLAVGTALRYAIPKRLASSKDLKVLYDEYEVRLRRWYGTKQEDRDMRVVPLPVNYE